MGRQSTFSQSVADLICDKLREGIALAEICRLPDMPKERTVSDWKAAHPTFAADFARAREDGYDAIADRLRLTARGKGVDDGGESTGDVQRDKLVVDLDMKLLARWSPKRYGEKVDLNHSGTMTYTVVTGVDGGLDGGAE